MSEEVMSAEEWYQRGNEARKRGQWHEAINAYIQAIELDPDSPAVEAKRMLDDIMAFYCKDMYNPWRIKIPTLNGVGIFFLSLYEFIDVTRRLNLPFTRHILVLSPWWTLQFSRELETLVRANSQ